MSYGRGFPHWPPCHWFVQHTHALIEKRSCHEKGRCSWEKNTLKLPVKTTINFQQKRCPPSRFFLLFTTVPIPLNQAPTIQEEVYQWVTLSHSQGTTAKDVASIPRDLLQFALGNHDTRTKRREGKFHREATKRDFF